MLFEIAKRHGLDLEEEAEDVYKRQDTTIDHVRDFEKIAAYGVMTTPALVVDGQVVSYGKVLDVYKRQG